MDIKRPLIFILIACLLLAAGCKKAAPIEVVDVMQGSGTVPAEAAAPQDITVQEGNAAALSPDEYGTTAKVEVSATAAHVFDGAEGVTLYGAAEYKNTGDCPVQLTNATFVFTVNGVSITQDFVPVLSEFDVVLPGQTSFVTLWLPQGASTAPSAPAAGQSATLSATLTCQRSELSRNEIGVSNIYLADNYPGFSTMSGTLTNASQADCALNMVYVGFYDTSGKLLGVWYFTRGAKLEAGESKDFVVHMKELPIPGLAGQIGSTLATGFGFN